MSSATTLDGDDRCGRMATTVTLESVSTVESLIRLDQKMTYAEIQDIMEIHREVSLTVFTAALA